MSDDLIIMVLAVAVTFVVLLVLKTWWRLDSVVDVPIEAVARWVPRPFSTSATVRRSFVRALTNEKVVMPSGRIHAVPHVELRVAPEDVARLHALGDLDALGADAATLYLRHARTEGWVVPGEVQVSVRVDPRLRTGWVPPARAVTPHPRPGDTSVAGRPRDQRTQHAATRAERGLDLVPTRATRSAQPEPVPTLHVTYDGVEHEVHDRALGLGRRHNGAFAIAEDTASWKHAMLEWHDDAWTVRDLGSTNGTRVDGARLTPHERRPVGRRAVLQLGAAVVVVKVRS